MDINVYSNFLRRKHNYLNNSFSLLTGSINELDKHAIIKTFEFYNN